MQKRTLVNLGIFLLVCLLTAIFLDDTASRAARLYDAQPAPVGWYATTRLATLYLLTPLVITAITASLMMPGVLLLLSARRQMHVGELLLKAFGLSFLAHVVTLSTLKAFTDGPVSGTQFEAALATLLCASYVWLLIRSGKDNPALAIFSDHVSRRRLIWFIAIPALFTAALLPSIFWQELNPDGFEAMEIGRTLSELMLPAFPTESGTLGLGIGMVPMAFPINWFMLLSGPLEAATRLPMAMYLVTVFAALLAFIEYKSPRQLKPAEELVILLALAGFTVTMSFSSGYDNYFTDISSPAAFETLTIIFILASGYFLITGMYRWYLPFTVAGFLARPTMLLFVLLLGIAIALIYREHRRARLVMTALAVGTWIALVIGYENIFLASAAGAAEPGYSSSSIIDRFRYLTLHDVHRFIYAAVPVGLLPALSLLAFRWQDDIARCLTLVTAGYFFVFFVPAFISLHHFVPAMIIPLIVLWRLIVAHADRMLPAVTTGAVTLVCVWLSLPQDFHISRTFTGIGERMAFQIGDYHGDYPAYRQAIAGSELLYTLFRPDWEVDDPAQELVGDNHLLYYASQEKMPGQTIDYRVLPPDAAPPDSFVRIAADDTGSVWVRDLAILEADRSNPPPTGYRSLLYDIQPDTLFPYRGVPVRNYDFNIGGLPLIRRLFQD
jgi:hypothetical protein